MEHGGFIGRGLFDAARLSSNSARYLVGWCEFLGLVVLIVLLALRLSKERLALCVDELDQIDKCEDAAELTLVPRSAKKSVNCLVNKKVI